MKLFAIFAIIFCLIPFAIGATFTFDPDPFGTIFTIPERSNFTIDLNVTVNETLLKYSIISFVFVRLNIKKKILLDYSIANPL